MRDTNRGTATRLSSSDKPVEGILVDLNTSKLRHNHVLVQRSPGVELYIGFGLVATRALDFAFENEYEPTAFLTQCAELDQSLESGDLVKAQLFGITPELAAIDEPHLRRLALLEARLAKAAVDDAVHPGYPAGDPEGRGGQFRPKDKTAEEKEATRQKLKRLEARKEFRIAAVAALKLGVTAAMNLIPGAGEVADVEELIELGKTAIELGNAEIEVSEAIDFVKNGPYCLDDLRVSRDDQSFSSFSGFKKISPAIEALIKMFGNADRGNEYHHIVEQGGRNDTTLPAEQLQSTKNIIPLPRLLHELVSAEYSEKSDQDSTKTVREWLQTQSYDKQWDYGVKTLRDLGIVRPDC